MPNRWQALSKAGWAVSGLMTLGRCTPRLSAAKSRYASMAWQMLPVPPVDTSPTGSPSSTASAWSRSRVMAMISASNFVALGHRSRWSTLTWANSPNASFMNR